MAPPPLERNDLYAKDSWKTRTTGSWRLPRRTRRATYACWTLVIATVYFIVTSATSWRVQVPQYFEKKPEALIQIRFPRLYNTLSQVAGNGGIKRWNRNVVYMAANLTAASKLAGLACEMGEYRRTNVHFAFLGFDDIDLDDFRHINGLPQSDDVNGCRIYFHDARPERSSELNVERQKVSTKSAFRHVLRFIHPQAVFIDPTREADWFLQIARDKARQMDSTLVELPDRFNEDLQWLARLDGGSLNGMCPLRSPRATPCRPVDPRFMTSHPPLIPTRISRPPLTPPSLVKTHLQHPNPRRYPRWQPGTSPPFHCFRMVPHPSAASHIDHDHHVPSRSRPPFYQAVLAELLLA
jgi:hypothetical protein